MRNRFESAGTERGATIVEYSMLMSLFVVALIPVLALTTNGVAAAHDNAASHFSTTLHSYSEDDGGGGGGGGGTSTTTTTVPPTTTTVPPTTTTTVPPTTTTVPPTTTTTTVPPNQVETADYNGEIVVVFSETDGVVGYEIVEAEGWTVEILVENDDKVRLRFTRQDPYLRVIAKGWLVDDPGGDDDGELSAKTNELDN
ncbi:MAG: hypothetical protein M3112_01940 [Actinomycetia bacterium]|nr:hypothetical protein [Actinomycetes bacterium]